MFDNQEVKQIIFRENMYHAIMDVVNPDEIVDENLQNFWIIAKNAISAIEKILELK